LDIPNSILSLGELLKTKIMHAMVSPIPRKYPFEYSEERLFIVNNKDSSIAIGEFLDERFRDDFSKAEDLIDWGEVLCIILSLLRASSVYAATSLNPEVPHEDLKAAVSILTFLSRLIRGAKDKRCFVEFQEMHTLMKSPFQAVSQLACEIVFHVCVPASSISSNVHDDWADCIEVPMFIASTVQKMLATVWTVFPSGSFLKYISNDIDLSESVLENSVKQVLGKNFDSTSIIISLLKDDQISSLPDVLEGVDEKDVSDTIFYIQLAYRAWFASDSSSRESVVRTVLFAFFILIHSKLSSTEVIEYVKTGTEFTKDLVSLGDVSRNSLKYPNLVDGLPMSHICLENILGLIESRLRRRSSMTLNSNILEVLNLDDSPSSALSSSEDICWISIVSSACSNATVLFEPDHHPTHYTTVGKFTRLGLELYALALTIRDQSHMITDIRVVSTIVSLLRACAAEFKILLEGYPATLATSRSVQLMLVMSKILYCLELTVQKSGYTNIFRECDGLEPVVGLLTMFGDFMEPLDVWFTSCPFGASILETALSVVTISIQKYRPSAAAGRSLNESGYSYLFSPSFISLGQKIVQKISGSSDTVWGEYLMLLKEIIDYEPTYLAYFLQSELVDSFKKAFSNGVPNYEFTKSSCRIDLENIISSLLRFAFSACITNEGRNFLIESKIIEYVIEGIQHPLVIVPYSFGISSDKVSKIGALLGQVLVESYQQFRPTFLAAFKSRMEELLGSIDAHSLSIEFMEGVEPNSPRSQLLQRLTNLCIVIEHLFTSTRRHQTDLARDVVVDYIPKLFTAYQCAFPPAQQLFTQLTLHTNTPAQSLGNAGCMKAITAVLKVASASSPQDLMQHILKAVEETINKVATAKMMLSKKEDIPEDTMEDTLLPGKARKSRSRGSSFGTQSAATQAHIYGALAYVPDATLVAPTFSEFLAIDDAYEKYLWQFVTGVSTVEWLCLMLSHSLRSIHRSSNHAQIANLVGWKDNLRHLYSFLKSASLEVATYSVQYLQSKAMDQCKMKSSLDVFLFESGLRPLQGRFVNQFILRVIGSGGALVREGVEIDGSRVVYVIDIGTEIVAYERKINAAGVIRYRTDLGWISEYRRDQSKSPIVEIVSVSTNEYSSVIPTSYESEVGVLMTIREGIYCVLSRLNQSLRQISVYLARLLTVQEQRVFVYNPQSYALATTMSKYYKGFMDYVDERLGDPNINENVPIRCLFMANFIKNAMIPALEDKNGNFNVLLLRSFSVCGLIKSLIDEWGVCLKLLKSESKIATASADKKLGPAGRSALYSTQIFIIFIRKLINRDSMKKSTANRSALSDESGSFSAPDLITPILRACVEGLTSLLREEEPYYLSSDMTSDVLSATVELYRSVKGVIADIGVTASTEGESSIHRTVLSLGREFTSLRTRSQINRFVEMGFARDHIARCMQLASDPNAFDEVYELLVSTLGAQEATPGAAQPATAEAAPTVGIEGTETFREPSSSPFPFWTAPPTPANGDTAADSLPNLVSNLGVWDETSGSRGGIGAIPPAPSYRQTSRSGEGMGRRQLATGLTTPPVAALSPKVGQRLSAADVSRTPKTDESPSVFFERALQSIETSIVPFCLRICQSFHYVERWDKKETFSLFPHMRNVVQTISKSSAGESVLLDRLIESVLASLQEQLLATNHEDIKPYGLIIFCSSITKAEEQSINAMKKQMTYPVLLKILQSINTFISLSLSSSLPLATHASPAVVLLSQVLTLIHANESFIQEQLDILLKSRVPSSAEGKEEVGLLIEAKEQENVTRVILEQVSVTLTNLLSSFEKNPCSRRIYSSVVEAFSQITSYHVFADAFIFNGGLEKILSLRTTDELESGDNPLAVECCSRLIQKCLETPAILQVDFAQVIKSFFKALPSQESKISFDKFLRGHFLFISRSPEDFWLVTTKLLKFRKANTSETGLHRKILMVELASEVELEHPLVRKSDRSYIALKALVDHCISLVSNTMNSSNSNKYLTLSDCIQILAETSVSARHGANIVSFVASNVECQAHSFIEYLLQYCFGKIKIDSANASLSLQLQASTRLFLSLAASRGSSRALVCNAILTELRACASQISSNSALISEIGLLLQRLCKLIVLICQSNKANPGENEARIDSVISVDTIKLLLVDGSALEHIVTILLSLDQSLDTDSKVWTSILSAIELFTRPQLLQHLEKTLEEENQQKYSESVAETVSMQAPSTPIASSSERQVQLLQNSVLQEERGESGVAERFYYGETVTPLGRALDDSNQEEEHDSQLNQGFREQSVVILNDVEEDHNEHAEEEEDDEEEEEEEEEDGEDEEEDEEDEDDEEEDDEDLGDEDGDDDDDYPENNHQDANPSVTLFNNQNGPVTISINVDGNQITTTGALQPESILGNYISSALRRSANEDTYVSVEFPVPPPLERSRQAEALATSRSAFESENPAAIQANYVTPPDQARGFQALLRSMAEGVEPRDGSILEDVFRRLGVDHSSAALLAPGVPGFGSMNNSQIADDELLPMSITRALESRSNLSTGFNPYVNPVVSAGRSSRSNRHPPAFSAGGARMMTSGIAGFGFGREEPGEATPDVFGEEGDPSALPLAAMWPGGGHSPAVPPPSSYFSSFVSTANPNPISLSPSPALVEASNVDSLSRAFQERFESFLFPESETGGDESVADTTTSQESTAANSRTGPLFDNSSLPSTSVQAVQDPNPRQNGGEEDSVRGGPIPPLIEIESPDHEAYEEMSVLTVPQEEQHDDTGSHAFRAIGYRGRIAIRDVRTLAQSGESVTGSVDDQESLRTTPNPGTVADDEHTIRTVPPIEEETYDGEQESRDSSDDGDDDDDSHHDSITMGGVSALDNDTLHSESRVFDHDEGIYSVLDASEASVMSGGVSIAGMTDPFPISDTPQIPESDAPDSEDLHEQQTILSSAVPSLVTTPSIVASAGVLTDAQEALNDLGNDNETNSNVEAVAELPEPANFTVSTEDILEETADGTEDAQESAPEGQLMCPPGYDEDVFYSLPPEMQMEVIDQHNETADQMRDLVAASGFDYETIMSLPDDIRQEVLDQARRQRESERALLNPTEIAEGAGGSGATAAPAEVDNMAFLSSLTLELRAEVLLTAEQGFLDSLPAEVQAEAQTLRDRAASSWQHREIMQVNGMPGGGEVGDRGGMGIGIAAAHAGGPMASTRLLHHQQHHIHHQHGMEEDEEFESEEDDDYDLIDVGGALPRARGNLREIRSSFERSLNRRPRTGIVQIRMDSEVKYQLPAKLLLAITRVLVSSIKHQSRVTDTLLQVLQNICRTNREKDSLAKLLIALITNQPRLLEDAAQTIGEDMALVLHQLDLSSSSTSDCRSLSSTTMLETSSVAWRRVVFILTTICAHGSSLNLLSLLPRSVSFTAVFEPGGQVTVTRKSAIQKDESLSPLIMLGSPHDASTESLLEQIVRSLPLVLRSNNQQDLEIISQLVENMSQPLDNLPDQADNFTPVLPTGAEAENEKLMRLVSVVVPPVVFDRDSLAILCEVLMSDLCNVRVVRAITMTLSRITKFKSNATIAIELMCDALGEIGSQTKIAVDSFTYSVRRATVSTQQRGGKATVPSLSTTAVTAATSYASVAATTANAVAAAEGEMHDPISLARIPSVSVIPLVESVDHHVFDRFVRVIQTLQSIAEKSYPTSPASAAVGLDRLHTDRSLYDLAPVETMNQVWNSLDHALAALKVFIVDDDSLEAEGIKSTPKLTSLLSAARRLLPLIESFFVIYANDLLRDADATSSSSSSGSGTGIGAGTDETSSAAAAVPAATSAVDINVTETNMNQAGEQSAVVVPATPPIASVPTSVANTVVTTAPQSKIPGQRYRTTAEYRRVNISLPSSQDVLVGSSVSGSGPNSPDHLHHSHHYPLQVSMSRTRSFNNVDPLSNFVSSRYRRLLQFVHNHRSLLNMIIKSKPSLLETSFAPLIRITQLRSYLTFEVKRKYFFSKLKKIQQHAGRRGVHLQIRRNQVFEDSYQQLRGRSASDMRGRLQIQFYGEQGIDAGGLTREWFSILAREIFNAGYALFMAAADGATFQPNPLSFINSNHLDYFKFVGRIIGKAICDGQLMDAHFTRSFYKHLLGMPIEFNDIEATEPDYYKSLKMMLEHPLEDLGFTGMTFTAEIQKFGRTEDVELIPNGAQIMVTDDNKHEYVRLIAHHRMTAGIFPQIDSFLAGFYELVPPELICIFSPTELELLICGLPDVNIDELQLHTEYHQYRPTDPAILWFWEALRSFNREERALFLQFVTGTSKVPLGGFAHLQGMRGNQKFTIHKSVGAESGTLPCAHTCYNQLDLPEYSTAEEMREKLLLAITEGSEGFGFA
jgi:E3 ubiquitin-protein ligase HUWE1